MIAQGIAASLRQITPMWLRYRIMDLRGRGVYSHYANRYKCIFIHIPKAAGTSVAQTLFGQGSRHVPYFEYEKANPWKFRRYFKFAFVRNPWDRLVSTYFFLKHGGISELDISWARENLSSYANFADFVKNGLSKESILSWVHFKPQHYFICDQTMKVKVDFVGRFESINRDFDAVACRLGCDRRLKMLNAGDHASYAKYYDADIREIVGRVYRRDIALFGYEFHMSK